MKAGRLTEVVTLFEPEITRNEFGDETVVYAERSTVRAELSKYSGRRSEEVSEHFPDYSARFIIYLTVPVRENWRLQHVAGGNLYTVTNIEPDRHSDLKTLVCVRVNE